MTLFVVLAALMLAAALAFVLPTLLRGAPNAPRAQAQNRLKALNEAHAAGVLSDAEYAAKRAALGADLLDSLSAPQSPARNTRIATFAVALLLPAMAVLLYRDVGNPRALDPNAVTAPADHTQNMDQAIADLAAKLKQNPDDVEGWALLGRAYEATEHFADARDALKHAHELAPDDADVTAAYAEALALAGPTRRLEGESRALIDEVLKAVPDHERGLWLLGISEYQAKNYDAAITAWKHMLAVMPKDSDARASVQHQIDQAEAVRDGREAPADSSVASAPEPAAAAPTATAPTDAADAAADPHLHVEVTLDPKLKDKLSASDVLFVYAKAASGPPMPLAIQRMPANKLPVTVTLTDGMGMVPNLKLSQFPQVIIGARVSKSGNAIGQSGDLQTLTPPLATTTTDPIKLTIDQVVP